MTSSMDVGSDKESVESAEQEISVSAAQQDIPDNKEDTNL